MASSLEEQLKKVKLKKSQEPTKDFSTPKTSGFTSEAEIKDYERKVLDVNTEHWIDALEDVTFPTVLCPFFLEDAKLFMNIYERLYLNKDPADAISLDWKEKISQEEKTHIDGIIERLNTAMTIFTICNN